MVRYADGVPSQVFLTIRAHSGRGAAVRARPRSLGRSLGPPSLASRGHGRAAALLLRGVRGTWGEERHMSMADASSVAILTSYIYRKLRKSTQYLGFGAPQRTITKRAAPSSSVLVVEVPEGASPPSPAPAPRRRQPPTPPSPQTGSGSRRPRQRPHRIRIPDGSRILLKRTGETATVDWLDVIGQRYLLRSDDGRAWYETLQGPGSVQYRLISSPGEEEDAGAGASSPHTPEPAMASSVTTRNAERHAERNTVASCPICLDAFDDSATCGRMSCCDALVHTHCIARWRCAPLLPPSAHRHRPNPWRPADRSTHRVTRRPTHSHRLRVSITRRPRPPPFPPLD